MSQTVTFSDLVNLAIGTPELGSVNFNALHFLLHSMLQHFHLQDVPKEISEEELDFIKPTPKSSAVVPAEPQQLSRRSSSIFHQMHERILAIEKQLLFLNDTPTTTELLARTQLGVPPVPAQDMWQMMQLKKKMEVNEEGMSKVGGGGETGRVPATSPRVGFHAPFVSLARPNHLGHEHPAGFAEQHL